MNFWPWSSFCLQIVHYAANQRARYHWYFIVFLSSLLSSSSSCCIRMAENGRKDYHSTTCHTGQFPHASSPPHVVGLLFVTLYPQLFGSPGYQAVNSKGLPSVHSQVPSSSMSLPPTHHILQGASQSRSLLLGPSNTYSLIALEAKWPFFCWQKASASFQAESQKVKTFRIARFLSQKLSG